MKLKAGILALILTVFTAVTLSMSAFAEPISGTCDPSSITYEIGEDKTLKIMGEGEMPDYTADNTPWAEHVSSVLNIVIIDGVTSIGENAFVNIKVNEIAIPDSVTDIGHYALGYSYTGEYYTKIPEFTIIGETGTAAEAYADENGFEFKMKTLEDLTGDCGASVTYKLTPDGILTISGSGEMYSYIAVNTPWSSYISGDGDYVIKEVNVTDGVTSVGDRAFYGCSSLAKVSLSSSVTHIGDRAFANCMTLSSVSMSDGIVSIGNEAFSYCTALKTISLPETLQTLGKRAFSRSGLTEITLPESLNTVGEMVFNGCELLTDATINCATVPSQLFAESTSIKTVTLSNTVREIGEAAFKGCVSLSSVASTDSLVAVGQYAFEGCTSLAEIVFESTVENYGIYCFKDCTALTSFTFSDIVKTIPEGMFYGCASLSSVTLGDNVESIGNYAFVDCSGLSTIFVSYKVRTIGLHALGYAYSDGNYIPINGNVLEIEGFTPSVAMLYAEENGFNFKSYKTVDTDVGNVTDTIVWKFRPSTGVLSIIGQGQMPDYTSFAETPWYVYKTYIKQVTFSNGILNIGSFSFDGCESIESIDIPGTAQIIGTSAFAGTSIVTATIPSGVTRIETCAFEGCASLYTVSLPNTLLHIGEAAFRGPNIMTSILIPESVVEIGASAVGFNDDNTKIEGFKIKGVEGSLANTYADHKGIAFIINGYVEIVDTENDCKISILGDSTFGYKLNFNKLQPIFTPALLIPSDQAIIQYEIVLKFNDEDADFEGSAEVSFPIPQGMENKTLYVYTVADNGDFFAVSFDDSNGRITFSTTATGKCVLSTVDLSNLYVITVNYQYSNGSTVIEPLTVRATSGAQYRFTADKKKGYSLNEYAFSGTVADSDLTIDFIYAKKAGGSGKGSDNSTTKVVLTVLLVILIIALIAAVILLIYLNDKKKKQEKETGKTIKAASKKPAKVTEMEKTIVVPDFATREINIESLFADDPEEDLDAEEELRKK